MAPIKFEEHIKEKIEQRQIQPSSEAWQKLSDRLDEEPKQKFNFWWLGIAASVVGVAIVAVVMINNSAETREPILVNDDLETPAENINVEESIVNDEVFKNTQSVAEETPTKSIIPSEASQEKSVQSNAQIVTKKDLVKEEILQESMHNVTEVTVEEPIKKELSLEDAKVQEVVAQIQQLKKEQEHVSNEEIDALLQQAEKEIVAQRIYNNSTKTVSAEDLLLSVENDLDQSFRDRVFEALKSGYNTVKTAVAERNQ